MHEDADGVDEHGRCNVLSRSGEFQQVRGDDTAVRVRDEDYALEAFCAQDTMNFSRQDPAVGYLGRETKGDLEDLDCYDADLVIWWCMVVEGFDEGNVGV